MGLFKKPVKVKCYTRQELGNLLDWMRSQHGLSALNHQRAEITAVMAMQYWDNPTEVLYFEVTVPYYMFKKLRDSYIERESFDPLLQQRAIADLIGRSL